mgnify:FL=1
MGKEKGAKAKRQSDRAKACEIRGVKKDRRKKSHQNHFRKGCGFKKKDRTGAGRNGGCGSAWNGGDTGRNTPRPVFVGQCCPPAGHDDDQ